MKGQDILVLASLLSPRHSVPTLAELSNELGLSIATVHRSVQALQDAQLVDDERAPQLAQVDEFVTHALRYVFPPRMHGEARGVPTAWAAEPLRGKLAASSSYPLVWPHPHGRTRGVEFEPFHPAVPDIADRNPELGERLSLLDALRLNDARVRDLARKELHKQFAALK